MRGIDNGPFPLRLRDWQKSAFARYQGLRQRDFLMSAAPGSGKTPFALSVAYDHLQNRTAERVVVVVPTEHLRTQWKESAARVGLQLYSRFTNDEGQEAADYHGVVVTYQQVASNPAVHRRNCRRPTLVILDEPHHAGQELSWGSALREAFEPAAWRLLISGTPFRSDNNSIPFVNYREGRSVADFTYSYGDALRDGVCRAVFFPSFEGRMSWWTNSCGERSATFRDKLPEEEKARRLRTALYENGEWLPAVLREAEERLADVRRSQYGNAAGLAVTMDQHHARAVAQLLWQITGEAPALAISDDPQASEVIKAFAGGTGRWMVAVRMVSEGVDIPRLCVGVYATNILTELYFRQAVGRFVRMVEGVEDQVAWLFMPREETLVEYVQHIKEERDHVLAEEEESTDPHILGREGGQRVYDLFTPLHSQAEPDEVFFDHEAFTQEELSEARVTLTVAGLEKMPEVVVAKLLRAYRRRREDFDSASWSKQAESNGNSEKPAALEDEKEKVRHIVRRMVNHFCALTNFTHREVYNLLAVATGSYQGEATLEQLRMRQGVLRRWIDIAQSTEGPQTLEAWLEVARDAC